MPDSRKVHLLVERDPEVEKPPTQYTERYLVVSGNTGRVDLALYWDTEGIGAEFHSAGITGEHSFHPHIKSWMPLPTASDLTVEDVEAVMYAALEAAARDELDAENHGPTKAAQYRRSAAETRAAVAKARAALGMETP